VHRVRRRPASGKRDRAQHVVGVVGGEFDINDTGDEVYCPSVSSYLFRTRPAGEEWERFIALTGEPSTP
jgi:hypothetical protein